MPPSNSTSATSSSSSSSSSFLSAASSSSLLYPAPLLLRRVRFTTRPPLSPAGSSFSLIFARHSARFAAIFVPESLVVAFLVALDANGLALASTLGASSPTSTFD